MQTGGIELPRALPTFEAEKLLVTGAKSFKGVLGAREGMVSVGDLQLVRDGEDATRMVSQLNKRATFQD